MPPRFPPPGRLIDLAGLSLHLHEQGRGEPTVVLESGLTASSLSWSHVQPEMAKFTRVVSYDRAGLGWSDPCRTPRTVDQMIGELASLLRTAEIPPPYILVGHSFGGLLVRAFAASRAGEVAGVVMVDPVSLETWANCSQADRLRLAQGVKLSLRGARLARMGIVGFALGAAARGSRRMPKVIARLSAGKASGTLGRLIGEVKRLPPDVLPAVRWQWSRAQSFESMAKYLEALPGCAESAARMFLDPAIPLIVLSAGSATSSEIREREEWVGSASFGRHLQLPDCGHWLHLERPEDVVNAVRELVAIVAAR